MFSLEMLAFGALFLGVIAAFVWSGRTGWKRFAERFRADGSAPARGTTMMACPIWIEGSWKGWYSQLLGEVAVDREGIWLRAKAWGKGLALVRWREVVRVERKKDDENRWEAQVYVNGETAVVKVEGEASAEVEAAWAKFGKRR